MARAVILCVLLALGMTPAADAGQRYDPRLHFRTISTPRFDIHYHQGEEEHARRLATLAEAIATELEPRLGRPRARVHVILVDQSDLSNGWATPIPYNLIEIAAAAPRGGSTIGHTSDWLRLVLTHEYTHVLHLERSRGLLGAVGRAFGRHPFFYPNLTASPWQIEGLATYEESATSREGRMHAGDFRILMQRMAAAGRFPSLDVASHDIVQWPGGATPYLYGVFFHEYLARVYGEATLRRLADASAGYVPYVTPHAFSDVFGKSLGTLWDEFARDAVKRAPPPRVAAGQLTNHGFDVRQPRFASDGTLFYSVSDPHAFPAVMAMTPAGPRRVAHRVGGEQITAGASVVIFDQVEYVRSVGLQSDLYALDRKSGDVRRLTREARAGDPDLSPDGTTIVCTIQTSTGRGLATLAVPGRGSLATPRPLVAEPGVNYASPRWSPDGRSIAVERQALGETQEIVLLDAATGARQRVIALVRGRHTNPVWVGDTSILFASDMGSGPFQLYTADLSTGHLRRLANVDSAQAPAVSPGRDTLVFVGSTAAGYDLFSLPLADAQWELVPPAASDDPPRPFFGPHDGTDAPYRPWATLLPRFWTPVIEEEGEDVAIGAATGGFDALGRHGYAVSAAWSTRARPDWYASYVYARWRPTFFVDASDDEEPFRDGSLRVRELNAGAALTFQRVRRSQTLLGAFHAARETLDAADADRRAVRVAWTLDAAREYGFSISDEEGFTLGAATEWTRTALGADGNAAAALVDARAFRRLGPRHATVAARFAAARGWGDEPVRRVFAAGSSSPASSPGLDFDLDAVALLRGFETRDAVGDRAVVLNLDYRFPLAWVERGVGTWPVFLRSVHGAVFADAGAAWDAATSARAGRRASTGVELSADLVIGYSFPLATTIGVALRHDPSGRSRGPTVFGRVGRAF